MIRKALKLPSKAQVRKVLDEEFERALVVPVRISSQEVDFEVGAVVTVRALVDTGCTTSAISVKALGRVPFKRVPRSAKPWVATVMGRLPVRGLAKVFMQAEDGPEIPIPLVVMDLRALTAGHDFQMLLGLDYLRLAAARIDFGFGTVKFGFEMMPIRRAVLPAPVQVLPGAPLEPVLRSPYDDGLLPERVSVEVGVEDVHALERLVGRFRRAQAAGASVPGESSSEGC